MPEKTPSTLQKLSAALGYESSSAFAKDWRGLPDKDKDDLRGAVENGSMTY